MSVDHSTSADQFPVALYSDPLLYLTILPSFSELHCLK